MARACDITSGEYINGSKGPKTGTLRAARNSSAAAFCSAVYWSGGIVGRRSCAMAAVVIRRQVRAAKLTGRNDPIFPSFTSGSQAGLWVPAAGGVCTGGEGGRRPYASIDERSRLRAEAVKRGAWPPKSAVWLTTEMASTVYLPTTVSPLK